MKKKVLLISSGLLTLIIIIITIFIVNKNSNNEIVIKDNNNRINNSFLTLMLEQSDGTYRESTSNTWPSGNYAFNSELSRCENGGELRWDRENGIVNLLSNKSDACYVYFDLYNVVQISNVSTSTTYNSITVTVTTSGGENPVDKYYFSIDGGNSYQESTSPSYTFSNLTSNHEYTIQVYAKDTLGYESNEETIEVTTNAYVNPVVNSVTATNVEMDSITVSVNASGGSNSISRYYYSLNEGSGYINTTSNTYTFNNLTPGTTYNIRVYVVDTYEVQSNVYSLSVLTENVVYLSSVCSNGNNLASCLTNFYNSYGADATKIYYHNSSLANSAEDNSYRYAGANPNNYVCFGSDEATCPSDNLYRIIGVFDNQVKIIKTTSYGNYSWDTGNINTWVSYNKPNIREELSIFIGIYENTWMQKIATHSWNVGGISELNGLSIPQTSYIYEAGASHTGYEDNMRIGLMYVSDYGFAASPSYWTTNLASYSNAISNNWMYQDSFEWTISRNSDTTNRVFSILYGNVHSNSSANSSYAIRPCFYLNSDVEYASGSGTQSDPFRIT